MIDGIIESIAFGGEGILRHEGLVLFVPFTAKTDQVTVQIVSKRKNFAKAKLVSIDQPSIDRVEPRCPYFGTCGGCQFQHLNYPAQLTAKRTFIIDALKRIGKIAFTDVTVTPAIEQWHYRHRIRLKIKEKKVGFTGWEPSQFVPVKQCPIFIPPENSVLTTLQPLISTFNYEGIEEATLRLIKTENNTFLLAFQFTPHLPDNYKIAEEALHKNPTWQGIVMQSEKEHCTFGNPQCQTQLLGLIAKFSPFGFLQNHPEQSENLYKAILDALPNNCTKILDLYCGVGITSLLFAGKGIEVIGVEYHAETIQFAKENAQLNHLDGVEFYEGKAEVLGVELLKKEKPELVLCNPPRTGMDPLLLEGLIKQKPSCILYVSCMPSTLARDLKFLVESGYKIESIQGFDMFPQTTHVETMVKLIL